MGHTFVRIAAYRWCLQFRKIGQCVHVEQAVFHELLNVIALSKFQKREYPIRFHNVRITKDIQE
jgi:hypothetical protein